MEKKHTQTNEYNFTGEDVRIALQAHFGVDLENAVFRLMDRHEDEYDSDGSRIRPDIDNSGLSFNFEVTNEIS